MKEQVIGIAKGFDFISLFKSLYASGIEGQMVVYLIVSPLVMMIISIFTLFFNNRNKFRMLIQCINTALVGIYIVFAQSLLNKVLSEKHLIFVLEKEYLPQYGYSFLDKMILDFGQKINLNDLLNKALYFVMVIFVLRVFLLFFLNRKKQRVRKSRK